MIPPSPDAAAQARAEIRRAWIQLAWADIQGARGAIAHAQRLLPDHPLPFAMGGALELAAGDLTCALKQLRGVTRSWPSAPCGHVYLAETCLLLGRAAQAERALNTARACDAQAHWRGHIDALQGLLEHAGDTRLTSPFPL